MTAIEMTEKEMAQITKNSAYFWQKCLIFRSKMSKVIYVCFDTAGICNRCLRDP